jgi:hypothetical protein
MENVRKYLIDNPEIADKIENKIKAKVGLLKEKEPQKEK